MNTQQIESFVMCYLESHNCHIIEKGKFHVTVKLSPEADKDLTQRSYYWSFVERTGVEPETMTFCFIFDPAQRNMENRIKQEAEQKPAPTGEANPVIPLGEVSVAGISDKGASVPVKPLSGLTIPGEPAAISPQPDSILGRYFGFVPTSIMAGRIPQEEVTFGSRRLEQIYAAVKSKGKFIRIFEEPTIQQRSSVRTTGYSSWFGINYKVEWACDMKREEIHSLAVNLTTGEILNGFHTILLTKKLSSRLPARTFLLPTKITFLRAIHLLENALEVKIKAYDHKWADEATARLEDELARVNSYYDELLVTVDTEKKQEIEEQYLNRQEEIDWQYRPKIRASVINCGLFHLNISVGQQIDDSR